MILVASYWLVESRHIEIIYSKVSFILKIYRSSLKFILLVKYFQNHIVSAKISFILSILSFISVRLSQYLSVVLLVMSV